MVHRAVYGYLLYTRDDLDDKLPKGKAPTTTWPSKSEDDDEISSIGLLDGTKCSATFEIPKATSYNDGQDEIKIAQKTSSTRLRGIGHILTA